MRILFLTNFYPPHHLGGQGQSCQKVFEELKKREHDTLVLTSNHGVQSGDPEEEEIVRGLYLEMDLVPLKNAFTFFINRKGREKRSLQCLIDTVATFQPDVIFVWGMWNLPRSLPLLAETLCPDRVVYRFAEYWPTLPSQHQIYWETPAKKWYSMVPKKIFATLALRRLLTEPSDAELKYRRAICVSQSTRQTLVDAGVPVGHARVVYTGVDVERFNGALRNGFRNPRPLKLLYAGRLTPDKGVETPILALTQLTMEKEVQPSLTIAGLGTPEYQQELKDLVRENDLSKCVKFVGQIPREEMPKFLESFDVLIVPSTWEEPLARIVLEGMTSGLVVLATPKGGTKEIVTDGLDGLLFNPGDAEDLAKKIMLLYANPELRYELAKAARQTVKRRFNTKKMIDEIETFLKETIAFEQPADKRSKPLYN